MAARKKKLIELINKKERFINSHLFLKRIAENRRYRIVLFAWQSLTINILYALYNAALGVWNNSVWFASMFVYYAILSVMRFCAVRSAGEIATNELRIMKICGVLFLLLTFALGGSVYLTITRDISTKYHEIVMISIAAYTFYKITRTIINMVKVKKENSPRLTTLRNISCVEALVSILSLQTSMFASFGGSTQSTYLKMNIATGSGVCLLVLTLGVSMIMATNKKIEKEY